VHETEHCVELHGVISAWRAMQTHVRKCRGGVGARYGARCMEMERWRRAAWTAWRLRWTLPDVERP